MKSEEAVDHLSKVIMILLYLKQKTLKSGKVNFYRNKGLSLPIYHLQQP